jgi:hypothetical protein
MTKYIHMKKRDQNLIWEAYLTADKIDPKELELGIEIEQEHTTDLAEAEKIARDHLAEDPEYYTKLKKAGL